MHHEHQGMRLWVEPDERLAAGAIQPGSDVNLTVGVEPADASNRVQVRYRVNGGPAAAISAEPVRHVGNAQYFKAQLPCAALCDGDTVEYSAVCQCAGRQVPSAAETEAYASSFRVMSAGVTDRNASASTYATRMNPTSTASSHLNTRHQTVVRDTNQLKPTHLSLFVLQRDSGNPIARMPFYAEVGVTSFSPPPKPECKLKEVIIIGLREFYSSSWGHAHTVPVDAESPPDTLAEPLCDALSRLLAQGTIDRMAGDPAYVVPIISGILQKATDLATGNYIDPNDPEAVRKLLEDAIRAYAKEHDLPLAGTSTQDQRIVWAHPLGVLATDHVGYLSFDLTRLPPDVASAVGLALEARRRDPDALTDTSIWIYPMAREDARVDALAQVRFADDAIVVRLELDLELDPITCLPKLCEPLKNSGFMAMQNPSLTDWRLSPGSFGTNPGALVGADGCEMVLPSNTALHEFNFHQVIGVPAADVGLPIDPAAAGKVRPGFVNEYRLSFIPIGHSLGQILYTFPLAPGESVNFAVIDWTRRDSALRTEATKLDESLVHELRRDRVITETVQASIDEWQRGGSLMGGLASSIGGAIGGGGMGAAAGASNAIGGGYSTTSGSRDIAANTVQKLSDNVAQAATSARELHSTVVVQSSQAEHEAIETRTVVNYNHSHALTILYYEVLRHFRVVTEFVRRRPALLTNIHGGIAYPVKDADPPRHDIWWPTIHENRKILEEALLDDRYKEGFDIAERRRHRDHVAKVLGPPPTPKDPPDPPAPQGPQFRYFLFEMRTGGLWADEPNEDVKIWVHFHLNSDPWWIPLNKDQRISLPGYFADKDTTYWFAGRTEPPQQRTIAWGQIEAVNIFVDIERGQERGTDVAFSFIKVTGVDTDSHETILFEKDYGAGHVILNNDAWLLLPTKRPAPIPPPPGRSAESIEEEVKLKEFIEHLLNRRPHYERALRLGAPPVMRAFELASLGVGGGASLLEKVDNRPLEVLGDYVAYPCTDPDWSRKIMNAYKKAIEALKSPEVEAVERVERLVTLPSRGVFAEAKLGHCNASEEIDPTRFWKWEEHPIPHSAPEIAAIEAGKHTVINPDLKSTPFPQPLVNIVNPPNAPDPTGLASAMNVLAASNIFRDMSGRAEVADLLKKLSDSSVAIAGVAQKAATGGADEANGGSGGGASSGLGTGSGGGKGGASGSSGLGGGAGSVGRRSAPPGTPQTVAEGNDLVSGIRENVPPAQANPMARQFYQDVVDRAGAGTDGGVIPSTLGAIERILDDLTTELQARGLQLPPNIQSDLEEIRSAARLLGGGSEPSPVEFAVDYPPRERPGFQLAVALPLAAGAAAAAAEALMLALIAMMALLVIIQAAPTMGRALEDLLRKIQIVMAEFLDKVKDTVAATEDMVKQNSKAAMRCSAEILLFRMLTNELIDLLTIRRGKDQLARVRTRKQITETSEKWLDAVKNLWACLNEVDPLDVA